MPSISLIQEVFACPYPSVQPTGMPVGVALFFVSYQLLITFTMVNVVVCVLVDEFCGGSDTSNEPGYVAAYLCLKFMLVRVYLFTRVICTRS